MCRYLGISSDDFWAMTPRETQAILKCYNDELTERDSQFARICANLWNSRRSSNQQKIWKIADFMARQLPRPKPRQRDPLEVIRRLDAYEIARTRKG